MIYKIM